MGVSAVIATLLMAAPEGAVEARVLVAPVVGLGMTEAVADRLREVVFEALGNSGARVIADAMEPACPSDPECIRRAANAVDAHGVVVVSALRVGPTVQLTYRVVAASGEVIIDRSKRIRAKGFPAVGMFARLAEQIVATLLPAAPISEPTTPDAPTEAPAPVAAEAISAPPPAPEEPALTSRWIGLGASTACVAGGVTLLLLARADVARVEDAAPGTPWRDVEGAYNRAPVLSGIGWALVGLGVAGGVASFLWLPLGAETRVTLGASPTLSGVVAVGRF